MCMITKGILNLDHDFIYLFVRHKHTRTVSCLLDAFFISSIHFSQIRCTMVCTILNILIRKVVDFQIPLRLTKADNQSAYENFKN